MIRQCRPWPSHRPRPNRNRKPTLKIRRTLAGESAGRLANSARSLGRSWGMRPSSELVPPWEQTWSIRSFNMVDERVSRRRCFDCLDCLPIDSWRAAMLESQRVDTSDGVCYCIFVAWQETWYTGVQTRAHAFIEEESIAPFAFVRVMAVLAASLCDVLVRAGVAVKGHPANRLACLVSLGPPAANK